MGDVENGSVLGLPLTKRSRVRSQDSLLSLCCCVTEEVGSDKLACAQRAERCVHLSTSLSLLFSVL